MADDARAARLAGMVALVLVPTVSTAVVVGLGLSAFTGRLAPVTVPPSATGIGPAVIIVAPPAAPPHRAVIALPEQPTPVVAAVPPRQHAEPAIVSSSVTAAPEPGRSPIATPRVPLPAASPPTPTSTVAVLTVTASAPITSRPAIVGSARRVHRPTEGWRPLRPLSGPPMVVRHPVHGSAVEDPVEQPVEHLQSERTRHQREEPRHRARTPGRHVHDGPAGHRSSGHRSDG